MRLRIKLLVALLSICLLVSLAFGFFLHRYGTEFFTIQLTNDQMRMGHLLARSINAYTHKDIVNAAHQQPDTYQRLVNSLRSARHNSDQISALFTLNYDPAKDSFVYGIDTNLIVRDTILLQTDGLDFFLGINENGDPVIEHNGRQASGDLEFKERGRKYRFEKKDGNLFLNDKRLFTFLHSSPLEVFTSDGSLNKDNYSRTIAGVKLVFMAKGDPRNLPGAPYKDDAAHVVKIKNSFKGNHDEIEKATDKRQTRILSVIPDEDGKPAGILVVETNAIELKNLQRAMLVSASIIIGCAVLLSTLIALILARHIRRMKSSEPIFEMLAPSSKLLTFSDSNELAANIDTSHPVLFCALDSDKEPGTIHKYLDQFEKYLYSNGALIVQRVDQSLLTLFPAGTKTALATALELHKKLHRTNKTLISKGRSAIRISSGMHVGKANLATTPDKKTTIVAPALDLARDLALLATRMNVGFITTEPLRKRLDNPKAQEMRFIGTVRSRTTGKRMRIYDVHGAESPEICALRNRTRSDVETGISLFYEKRIAEADERFAAALSIDDSDPVARRYYSQTQRSLGATTPAMNQYESTG